MSEKRYAVIHFTDGTKLTLDFPKQGEDINVAKKMQKLMDSPVLMIEADGTLLTIPMNSIKYIGICEYICNTITSTHLDLIEISYISSSYFS